MLATGARTRCARHGAWCVVRGAWCMVLTVAGPAGGWVSGTEGGARTYKERTDPSIVSCPSTP